MGRDADVVGGEPGVELEGSARGHRLGAAVAEALERESSVGEGLLLLELGLDVVEGEGEEGREETGDGRRAEGGGETGDAVLLHHLLGLVVGREHAHVERHGANGGGAGAREEAADALLLDGVRERVDDAGVVATLGDGEGLIGLHADQGEIRGGAEDGAKTAGGETGASFLREGQALHIRYDAFPYQKFGVQTGEITNISPSLILPGELIDVPISINEPAYLVTAKISANEILAYGNNISLKAGMTFSADVHLSQRTLMEWLMEPIYSIKGKL